MSIAGSSSLRRLKDAALIMHLPKLAAIGGRATGRREWRRYERLAEVCENLLNGSCFGDEGDQPDVAAIVRALERKLLPHTLPPPREDTAPQEVSPRTSRAGSSGATAPSGPCRATSRRNSAAISPITHADLATLTERVCRRVIRWFRLTHLLDAAAAADMLAWENSGFSVDTSVRIALIDRDVPSYFQSLEHLLRYCARPPFARERLSVTGDASGRIRRVRAATAQSRQLGRPGPHAKVHTAGGQRRCRALAV